MLGNCYVYLKEYDKAVQAYQRLIELFPAVAAAEKLPGFPAGAAEDAAAGGKKETLSNHLPPSGLFFATTARDERCQARAGRVTTKNGAFDTPAFMPVGTAGTVKALTPEQLATGRGPDHPGQHLPPVPAPGHRHHPANSARCTASWPGTSPS